MFDDTNEISYLLLCIATIEENSSFLKVKKNRGNLNINQSFYLHPLHTLGWIKAKFQSLIDSYFLSLSKIIFVLVATKPALFILNLQIWYKST